MGAPQTLPANFKGWDQAPATLPANFNQWDEARGNTKAAQPSVMQVLTQPSEKTDQEYLGYTGPAGVVGATLHGLNDVAQGTKDAIKGAYDSVAQPPQDKTETAVSALSPAALPVYRILRGLGHSAADATHVAAAIHDINQSPDPLGTYANAAEKTAAQGAGQALVALGTEGAAKSAPAIAEAATGPTAARVARTAGKTALDIAQDVPIVRQVLKLKKNWQATAPELDATAENAAYAGEEKPPAPAEPSAALGETKAVSAETPPETPVKPAQVEQQLTEALGGQKLVPGVALKNQPAAMAAAAGKLPEGFTPVESSALKGYKYDPTTREFESITQGGQHYVHGDVAPEDAAAFEQAESKGKAWQQIRENPLVAKIVNGKRVPIVKPRTVVTDPATGKPEFSDVLEAKQKPTQNALPAQSPAPTEAAEGDLTALLQKSLDQIQAKKGGVMTTADPAELSKRWGVDQESLSAGREQTRGMSPQQTEEYIDKLAESYKKGRPVEPVMETRDADNNVVAVDGRARAIAAQRAGVKRVPIMIRRLAKATAQ